MLVSAVGNVFNNRLARIESFRRGLGCCMWFLNYDKSKKETV